VNVVDVGKLRGCLLIKFPFWWRAAGEFKIVMAVNVVFSIFLYRSLVLSSCHGRGLGLLSFG
jgi:hypothetical protein